MSDDKATISSSIKQIGLIHTVRINPWSVGFKADGFHLVIMASFDLEVSGTCIKMVSGEFESMSKHLNALIGSSVADIDLSDERLVIVLSNDLKIEVQAFNDGLESYLLSIGEKFYTVGY